MKDDDESERIRLKIDLEKKERKQEELTPEQIEQRKQQSALWVQGPEERVQKAKELKEARKNELVFLPGDRVRTIQSYLTDDAHAWPAIFTHNSGYFDELYRVGGYIFDGDDPKDWKKKPIVAVLFNELFYHRLANDKSIVTILRAKVFVGGHRKHKFYHFCNQEGRDMIIQYRDEIINMLKGFGRDQLTEFRLEYAERNKLPHTLRLFPK